MPHDQNLQHGGFVSYPYPPPAHPSSTDSDSMDSLSTEAHPFGDHNQHQHQHPDQNSATDEQFFVGDMDLEQLDPWRRNVPSPMPRITDTITQGMFC
jgi:hypothetical protein